MHMSAVGTKRTSRYVRYLSAFGAKLTLTEPREPPLAGRRYLRRCREGATRVDLSGNPDGKVSADQARRARVIRDWAEDRERRARGQNKKNPHPGPGGDPRGALNPGPTPPPPTPFLE